VAAPVSCLGRAEEPHLPGVLSRRRLQDPRIAHFLLLLAPRRSTLKNLACAGISRFATTKLTGHKTEAVYRSEQAKRTMSAMLKMKKLDIDVLKNA